MARFVLCICFFFRENNMRIFKSFLAVTAVLAMSAANATVIDFEDLAGQSGLPANYAGLTWGSQWMHYDSPQSPYTPASGTQRIYNNDSSGSTDWFKFSSDVVFNGAYFAGRDAAQFELYNDGALMFTSSTLSLSALPTFMASGYSGLIDEVRLNVTNGYFVMDDVTYNRSSNDVPEPSGIALLGLGLFALAGLRRKQA